MTFFPQDIRSSVRMAIVGVIFTFGFISRGPLRKDRVRDREHSHVVQLRRETDLECPQRWLSIGERQRFCERSHANAMPARGVELERRGDRESAKHIPSGRCLGTREARLQSRLGLEVALLLGAHHALEICELDVAVRPRDRRRVDVLR